MEIEYLELSELQRLLREPASSVHPDWDSLKCVSVADLIHQIEHARKNEPQGECLQLAFKCKSNLYEALRAGYVCIAGLDSDALEDGLFKVSEDYKEVHMWDDAADVGIDPEHSIRLITLRHFDMAFGTQFHSVAPSLYIPRR